MVTENWVVELRRIGKENQPLVVIDNFHPDPHALINEAATRPFAALAPNYPGVRAQAPEPYLQSIAHLQLRGILDEFKIARPWSLQECFFSMVTVPPGDLRPIQSIPHFDGAGDHKLAILHHLNAEDFGGTAFYRHKSTGIETVTSTNIEKYRQKINVEAAQYGTPTPRYFRETDNMFERISAAEHRFNRAIIYRGVNLHAIDLKPDFDFSADPRRGRLTINTFISGSGPL